MIRYEEHPEQGYVEVVLDGKVDRASFEVAVDKMGRLMDERGKVGLLKHVVSFGAIEPSLLWDDLKFAYHHLKHVGPVAVVSDTRCQPWPIRLSPDRHDEWRVIRHTLPQ